MQLIALLVVVMVDSKCLRLSSGHKILHDGVCIVCMHANNVSYSQMHIYLKHVETNILSSRCKADGAQFLSSENRIPANDLVSQAGQRRFQRDRCHDGYSANCDNKRNVTIERDLGN